jgi:hypothetical protein
MKENAESRELQMKEGKPLNKELDGTVETTRCSCPVSAPFA